MLGLVCEGAANRHIAAATGLSLPSVKKAVSRLLEVFGATSRTQLVADFYRSSRPGGK